MNEIWKDVVGYEGKYQVSNYGRVKSLNYRGTGQERILKQTFNTCDYLAVVLRKDGERRQLMVHRLVAETFIANPDNKPRVSHINTVRVDNRAENLCWASQKEILNNPLVKKYRGIKVICEDIIFDSIAECAEHYGVKRVTMYKWLDGTSPMASDFYKKGLSLYM